MRLLEKGLHGGLGIGNLGAVVAGHGVGKTSFLVGVAIDELLRGGTVLHVALEQPVGHVRDHYDAVFDALATSTHLADAAVTHAEIDTQRRIRAYKAEDFSATKLSDAVKIESEAGARPTLIVIDGLDAAPVGGDDLGGLPGGWAKHADHISVVLALEPDGEVVSLRALKDHENEDLQALHVGLDPRTLLLIRS